MPYLTQQHAIACWQCGEHACFFSGTAEAPGPMLCDKCQHEENSEKLCETCDQWAAEGDMREAGPRALLMCEDCLEEREIAQGTL